ncbi:MAG: SH3 domain-containing protein, partial [Thermoguttaceae bacterium]|nr:SH3 domain-containing protein [Thermoguttaceae bacterium]
MSKRSQSHRQRVFPPARPRRLVSTLLPVLTGLSGLCAPFISPVLPVLTDAPRLFAQTAPQNAQNKRQDQVVFFSIPVAVDSAVVRSAPSDSAYSTGSVAQNRYVEAYFRDANGWCAIRPPQGSFSWINAKFVRRENDSTGRVVAASGKAVPARVGGATVEESAIVQVGLQNGRAVKILGETRLSDGSTWLKIAPPAGEFRWLHSSALLADPAVARLPSKLTFQREFLERLARSPDAPLAASPTLENADRSQLLAQNAQNGRSSQTPSPTPSTQNPPLNADAPETLPASVVAAASADSTQTAETASPVVSEEFATQFKLEIARLNADVFQTLRQNPPSDAALALLASRAENLFDAAPTDGERFVVQSIYDAIKRAERQNRSKPTGAFPVPFDGFGAPASPGRPSFTDVPNGERSANRVGEFSADGEPPLLVLPDSAFEASDEARSFPLDASNGAAFHNPAQRADFNGSNAFAGFDASNGAVDFYAPPGFAPANGADARFFPTPSSPAQSDGASAEKKPRLAFAFSSANNPFRSKGKEVRVAPLASPTGTRSSGVSKLPPLLPSQKQLIVPPPNYRSNPLGQTTRQNGKLVAAKERSTENATVKSAATTNKIAQNKQTEQIAQEITTDSVRWRAADSLAERAARSESAATSASPTRSNVAKAAPIGTT